MRILVVEDEHKIASYIKRGLEEENYAVDLVYNGRDAMDWSEATSYDFIVLDILLPGMDGISVCRGLRKQGFQTPILMLTARDSIDDRVAGLDAGADDYLIKPFSMKELLARLRALRRRSTDVLKSSVLQVADLTLDLRSHRVQRGQKTVELTAKEYAVLECLMREKECVLSRTVIAEHIWNYDTFNQSNVIDVYIRNLRRKIDDPYEKKLIHTIRGAGYSISANDEMD